MLRSRNSGTSVAYPGVIVATVAVAAAAGVGTPLLSFYQLAWQFETWQLTLAFAVYAVALLATLLVAGSLSDHVGRRPVLLVALVLMIAASVLFLSESSVWTLTTARAVQGVATGAATSTFTALIIELARPARRAFMTVLTSAAPVAGLGAGALLGGWAVNTVADPTALIFLVLIGLFIVGIASVALVPETAVVTPGALRSLQPRLVVPSVAKGWYFSLLPLVAAGWMFSGLFLGLAPVVDREVFDVDSALANGLIVALQPLAAAVSGLFFARASSIVGARMGALLTFAGAALVMVSLATTSIAILVCAAIVGGVGQGAGFGSALRLIGQGADNSDRGALFAAVYLVAYLGYGVPVFAAGVAASAFGVSAVATTYAAAVAALGGAAAVLIAFRQTTRPRSFSAEVAP